MIIGQISDLHIGFAGKGVACKNNDRLDKVVKALNTMLQPPDLIIASGDLVEHGELWAYEALKEALTPIKCPVYLALGNHDRRDAFREIFPHYTYVDGFLQYAIEDYPVRILVLDTLEEGRHGGSFCQTRADWLETELARHPDVPTLLVLHHPPISTGIGWLTADPNAQWVQLLRGVVSRHNNVKHIAAGHIHRCIFKAFAGTTLSVTQAIAPQTKLELAKIDPEIPDGRGLLVEARPGFCLHYWDGDSFTIHSGQAPYGKTLARYDAGFASVIKHTMDLEH